MVTYRGSEIGRVTSIDVTPNGVKAALKLQSSTKVPSDVSAAVHSRSAVGEQFVELTAKSGDTTAPLGDGDVIPVGRTQIPPDIGGLLDATNKALKAIPQDNLRTVVDEADKAVAGLGPELSRIVDGSTDIAGGVTICSVKVVCRLPAVTATWKSPRLRVATSGGVLTTPWASVDAVWVRGVEVFWKSAVGPEPGRPSCGAFGSGWPEDNSMPGPSDPIGGWGALPSLPWL